jgi:Leucine-rich repeat (LRR) protein
LHLVQRMQIDCTTFANDLREFDFKSVKEISLKEAKCHIPFKLVCLVRNSFESFPNLETLEIDGRNLTKIQSDSFHNLQKLKKLNLMENQLNQIESHGFRGLENLEELYLLYNKLPKIESNTFQH